MTLSNNAPVAQLRDVMDAVLSALPSLTREVLESPSRRRIHARPRQILMALARETTSASLPQIGRFLGGRDHTTVLHGVRRIAALCEADHDLEVLVSQIRRRIYDIMAPDTSSPNNFRVRMKRLVAADPALSAQVARAINDSDVTAQGDAA